LRGSVRSRLAARFREQGIEPCRQGGRKRFEHGPIDEPPIGQRAIAVNLDVDVNGKRLQRTGDAAEHIVRDGQRTRFIAYSQTLWVDATAAEVYRRMRLWEAARERCWRRAACGGTSAAPGRT